MLGREQTQNLEKKFLSGFQKGGGLEGGRKVEAVLLYKVMRGAAGCAAASVLALYEVHIFLSMQRNCHH